jgi:hypothetical protein
LDELACRAVFSSLPHLEYLDLSINAYDLHERREEVSHMTVSRKKVRSASLSTHASLACTPDCSVAFSRVVEGAGGCRYQDTHCGDRWEPYLFDDFAPYSLRALCDGTDRRPYAYHDHALHFPESAEKS